MESKLKQDIDIVGVGKSYDTAGKSIEVLKDINLNIKAGEFVSILGHSGCGKSTLIRMIAGLENFQKGEIRIDGVPTVKPDARRGMIFQDHRLLPWLSVKDNLAFGYYESDVEKKNKDIDYQLKLVGLQDFKDAYPHQLSGGMSQRASIARALLHNPEVLLLDEPFGALDALTRMQLQKEILRIWETEKTTMILVTHDIDEAVYLSERVIILDGKPASVKSIIPIQMGRPRSRTSNDFAYYRRLIYREFFEEEEMTSDFSI